MYSGRQGSPESRLVCGELLGFKLNVLFGSFAASADKAELKKKFGIKGDVGRSTVRRWMNEHASYINYKASYYTDRHEDPDVRRDRLRYLEAEEADRPLQFEWLQMTMAEAKERGFDEDLKSYLTPEEGSFEFPKWFEYSVDGVNMLEIHVDHVDLDDVPAGNVSVRAPAGSKPILVLGQDECIFRANQAGSRCWAVHGETIMRKKEPGVGVMVSSFVDTIRGHGLPITDDELAEVNKRRAALPVPRAALAESPGMVLFDYGKNKSGYWDYENFTAQCVDVLDVASVIYPDYLIKMKLDRSGVHGKLKLDGHNVISMNMGIAGKQPTPAETKITSVDAHLGLWKPSLKVGMVQKFWYEPGARGPVVSTAPSTKWVGKPKGMIEVAAETGHWCHLKVKRNGRLSQSMTEDGYILTPELEAEMRSTANGVSFLDTPLSGSQRRAMERRAEGKRVLRDDLQVDAEAAYDPDAAREMEMEALVDVRTSLKLSLGGREDFLDEETLVEQVVREYQPLLSAEDVAALAGTRLRPNEPGYVPFCYVRWGIVCHPELAGDGIEYDWGKAKYYHRRHCDEQAKTLHVRVRAALSTSVIDVARRRRFARRARDYEVAYVRLHAEVDSATAERRRGGFSRVDIEKARQVNKCHRNSADTDAGFIQAN